MTEINAHVGSDGILNLRLPAEFVDSDVVIRVSRAGQTPVKRIADIEDPEERRRAWQQWVDKTAGRWEGELERPPQGQFEVREEL